MVNLGVTVGADGGLDVNAALSEDLIDRIFAALNAQSDLWLLRRLVKTVVLNLVVDGEDAAQARVAPDVRTL